MKKKLGFLLKTFLPLALGFYLIWYFFSSMSEESIEQFKTAFTEANYLYLGISLIFGFIAIVSRAVRWGYVLEPLGHDTPFWHRYHALMIGYLINLTIPRAGEASRAAMLYRSDKVPFAKSFGTIVAERAVDLIMLASIGLLTMYVGAGDFDAIWSEMLEKFGAKPSGEGGLPWKWIFLSVIALVGIIFFLKFRNNAEFKKKITEFVKGLVHGVLSIFKSKKPVLYVVHTIVIWVCYILMFAVCFDALDTTSDFPFKGVMIGFVAGSIGITFTNGGIGTYPLLVGLVIAFYLKGEHADQAVGIGNAMGMLIWVSQTFMMILLGLLSLFLLPKNYSSKDDPTAENTAEAEIA